MAYAGLASAYAVLADYSNTPAAETAAATRSSAPGLELDDRLGEAHAALAKVLMDYEWDWAGADGIRPGN